MIRKMLKSDFETLSNYYKDFLDSGIDPFESSNPFNTTMVYELENQVIGFISYSIIYERAEINYIYVEKKLRNNHIGSELMEFCIDEVSSSGCTNISLEVNENNIAGISLYEKFGFSKVATREKYYDGADALLMVRELI